VCPLSHKLANPGSSADGVVNHQATHAWHDVVRERPPKAPGSGASPPQCHDLVDSKFTS